jgi:hypothetical protein
MNLKNTIKVLITTLSILACAMIYFLFNGHSLPSWKIDEAEAIIDLARKFDQNSNAEYLKKYITDKYTTLEKSGLSSRPGHYFIYSTESEKFQMNIIGLDPSSCLLIASTLNSEPLKKSYASIRIGEFKEIFLNHGVKISSEVFNECLEKSGSISLTLHRKD